MRRIGKWILCAVVLAALMLSGILSPRLRQHVRECFFGGEGSPAAEVFCSSEQSEREVMSHAQTRP